MSRSSVADLSALTPDMAGREDHIDRPERFISFNTVAHRTALSRTTIWRLQRAGQFPRSIRLSAGRRGWLESQIEAWINTRVAEGSS
jgi:prophage regulatory protein